MFTAKSGRIDLWRFLPQMLTIEDEITAYEGMQNDLEAHDAGKWVLVHDRELIGEYDSFEAAAEDAVARFGKGPYLIRQIGAPPVTLPASVMYHPDYGPNRLRIP